MFFTFGSGFFFFFLSRGILGSELSDGSRRSGLCWRSSGNSETSMYSGVRLEPKRVGVSASTRASRDGVE
jgi:hypothetical protein